MCDVGKVNTVVEKTINPSTPLPCPACKTTMIYDGEYLGAGPLHCDVLRYTCPNPSCWRELIVQARPGASLPRSRWERRFRAESGSPDAQWGIDEATSGNDTSIISGRDYE